MSASDRLCPHCGREQHPYLHDTGTEIRCGDYVPPRRKWWKWSRPWKVAR